MKQEFDEAMLSEDLDSIDSLSQGFDWQALYERLGEDAQNGDIDRKVAEAVVRLIEKLVSNQDRPMYPQAVGLRLIGLAWVLNPAYFEGSPSLRDLAARCKVTPSTLARFTGEASRLIGWRNRGQRHAWNWQDLERSDLE